MANSKNKEEPADSSSRLLPKSLPKSPVLKKPNPRHSEIEMQNQELQDYNQHLKEAARRYRELYDFAPVGYFTLGSTGKILEINLTACKILGKPRSKLLGGHLFRLLPREDRDILYRHLAEPKNPCQMVEPEHGRENGM